MSITYKIFFGLFLLSSSLFAQNLSPITKDWAASVRLTKGQDFIARIVIIPYGDSDQILIEISQNANKFDIFYDKITEDNLLDVKSIQLKFSVSDDKIKSKIIKKFLKTSLPAIPETGMVLHQDGIIMSIASRFERKHWVYGDLPFYHDLEMLLIAILPKNMQTQQMKRWGK